MLPMSKKAINEIIQKHVKLLFEVLLENIQVIIIIRTTSTFFKTIY